MIGEPLKLEDVSVEDWTEEIGKPIQEDVIEEMPLDSEISIPKKTVEFEKPAKVEPKKYSWLDKLKAGITGTIGRIQKSFGEIKKREASGYDIQPEQYTAGESVYENIPDEYKSKIDYIGSVPIIPEDIKKGLTQADVENLSAYLIAQKAKGTREKGVELTQKGERKIEKAKETYPALIEGEKMLERLNKYVKDGNLSAIENFKFGDLMMQADKAIGYYTMIGDEESARQMAQYRNELSNIWGKIKSEEDKGKIRKYIDDIAQIIGGMSRSWVKRAAGTAAGAVVGAVAPPVGAAIATAANVSSSADWVLQGTGSMMADMMELGMPFDEAKRLAIGMGVIYDKIERMQFGKAVPASVQKEFKKNAIKGIFDAISKNKSKLVSMGLEYGKDVIQESIEEGLQGALQATAKEIAKEKTGKKDGSAIINILKQGASDFISSLGPMAIITAGGHIAGSGIAKATERAMEKNAEKERPPKEPKPDELPESLPKENVVTKEQEKVSEESKQVSEETKKEEPSVQKEKPVEVPKPNEGFPEEVSIPLDENEIVEESDDISTVQNNVLLLPDKSVEIKAEKNVKDKVENYYKGVTEEEIKDFMKQTLGTDDYVEAEKKLNALDDESKGYIINRALLDVIVNKNTNKDSFKKFSTDPFFRQAVINAINGEPNISNIVTALHDIDTNDKAKKDIESLAESLKEDKIKAIQSDKKFIDIVENAFGKDVINDEKNYPLLSHLYDQYQVVKNPELISNPDISATDIMHVMPLIKKDRNINERIGSFKTELKNKLQKSEAVVYSPFTAATQEESKKVLEKAKELGIIDSKNKIIYAITGKPAAKEFVDMAEYVTIDTAKKSSTHLNDYRQLKNLINTNKVSGLRSKASRSEYAEKMLKSKKDDEIVLYAAGDLVRFKALNDLLGHDVADNVINWVMNIGNYLSKKYFGGKLRFFHDSGDEFGIVAKVKNTDENKEIFNKFLEEFRDTVNSIFIVKGDTVIPVAASLGVIEYTGINSVAEAEALVSETLENGEKPGNVIAWQSGLYKGKTEKIKKLKGKSVAEIYSEAGLFGREEKKGEKSGAEKGIKKGAVSGKGLSEKKSGRKSSGINGTNAKKSGGTGKTGKQSNTGGVSGVSRKSGAATANGRNVDNGGKGRQDRGQAKGNERGNNNVVPEKRNDRAGKSNEASKRSDEGKNGLVIVHTDNKTGKKKVVAFAPNGVEQLVKELPSITDDSDIESYTGTKYKIIPKKVTVKKLKSAKDVEKYFSAPYVGMLARGRRGKITYDPTANIEAVIAPNGTMAFLWNGVDNGDKPYTIDMSNGERTDKALGVKSATPKIEGREKTLVDVMEFLRNTKAYVDAMRKYYRNWMRIYVNLSGGMYDTVMMYRLMMAFASNGAKSVYFYIPKENNALRIDSVDGKYTGIITHLKMDKSDVDYIEPLAKEQIVKNRKSISDDKKEALSLYSKIKSNSRGNIPSLQTVFADDNGNIWTTNTHVFVGKEGAYKGAVRIENNKNVSELRKQDDLPKPPKMLSQMPTWEADNGRGYAISKMLRLANEYESKGSGSSVYGHIQVTRNGISFSDGNIAITTYGFFDDIDRTDIKVVSGDALASVKNFVPEYVFADNDYLYLFGGGYLYAFKFSEALSEYAKKNNLSYRNAIEDIVDKEGTKKVEDAKSVKGILGDDIYDAFDIDDAEVLDTDGYVGLTSFYVSAIKKKKSETGESPQFLRLQYNAIDLSKQELAETLAKERSDKINVVFENIVHYKDENGENKTIVLNEETPSVVMTKDGVHHIYIAKNISADAYAEAITHEILGHVSLLDLLSKDINLYKKLYNLYKEDKEERKRLYDDYYDIAVKYLKDPTPERVDEYIYKEWLAKKFTQHIYQKPTSLTKKVIAFFKKLLVRLGIVGRHNIDAVWDLMQEKIKDKYKDMPFKQKVSDTILYLSKGANWRNRDLVVKAVDYYNLVNFKKRVMNEVKNIKELKKTARDYIKKKEELDGVKLIPKERKKVFDYIDRLGLKRDSSFEKAKEELLEVIDTAYENTQKEKIIKRIIKIAQKGKRLSKDLGEELKKILKDYDFRKLSKKKEEQLLELRKRGEFSPELARLKKKYIWDASVEEIENVKQRMLAYIEDYSSRKEQWLSAIVKGYGEDLAKAKHNLSTQGKRIEENKYLKPFREIGEKLKKKGVGGKVVDKLWGKGALTPDTIAEYLEGMSSWSSSSSLGRNVVLAMHEALNQYLANWYKIRDKIRAKFSYDFFKTKSAVYSPIERIAQTFKLQDGSEITLTPMQKISIYLLMQNSHSLKALLNENVYPSHELDKPGHKLDMNDLSLIVLSLTPEERAFAEFAREIINDFTTPKIRDTWKKLNFDEYAEFPVNYFPLRRIDIYKDYLTKGSTMGDLYNLITNELEAAGSLKKRSESARGSVVIEDALLELSRTINLAITYEAYGERLRRAKQLLHDVREDARKAGLYDQLQELNKYLQEVEGAIVYRQSEVENFLKKVISNLAGSALGLNPVVVARQLFSYPLILTENEFKDDKESFIKGLSVFKSVNKFNETYNHMVSKSPYFRSRFENDYAQSEVRQETSLGRIEDITGKPKSLKEKQLAGIGLADQAAIVAIGRACYYHIKKKNPNLGEEFAWDEAVRLAEKITTRTQPVYTVEHRSRMGRTKSLQERLLIMFTSVTNQMWNILARSIIKGDKKGMLFSIAVIQFANAFGMTLINYIWSVIRGKPYDMENVLSDIVKYTAGIAYLGNIPASLVADIIAYAKGDKRFMQSGRMFDNILLGSLSRLVRSVKNLFTRLPKDIKEEDIEGIAENIYYATSQAVRFLGYNIEAPKRYLIEPVERRLNKPSELEELFKNNGIRPVRTISIKKDGKTYRLKKKYADEYKREVLNNLEEMVNPIDVMQMPAKQRQKYLRRLVVTANRIAAVNYREIDDMFYVAKEEKEEDWNW